MYWKRFATLTARVLSVTTTLHCVLHSPFVIYEVWSLQWIKSKSFIGMLFGGDFFLLKICAVCHTYNFDFHIHLALQNDSELVCTVFIHITLIAPRIAFIPTNHIWSMKIVRLVKQIIVPSQQNTTMTTTTKNRPNNVTQKKIIDKSNR